MHSLNKRSSVIQQHLNFARLWKKKVEKECLGDLYYWTLATALYMKGVMERKKVSTVIKIKMRVN